MWLCVCVVVRQMKGRRPLAHTFMLHLSQTALSEQKKRKCSHEEGLRGRATHCCVVVLVVVVGRCLCGNLGNLLTFVTER